MRGDIIFGMVVGAVLGMTFATFNKDAQCVVKKSAETIANTTKDIVSKTQKSRKDDDE